MRLMTRLALCSLMASAGCLSAATITFQSSDLPDITPGQDLRRDVYSIGGITLQANEEIDIRFDPALYGTLSNGVAPPDFSLLNGLKLIRQTRFRRSGASSGCVHARGCQKIVSPSATRFDATGCAQRRPP